MVDNQCSDEDKALFQSHMKGVLPLSKTNTRVSLKPEKPKPKVRKQEQYPQKPPEEDMFLSNPYTLSVQAETILCHGRNTLATKQFKSLKQGLLPIQKRLDLHGLTIEKAREALSAFITQCFNQNLRYLLIIHGKGGQDFNAPLLKNHVNHWLKQYPQVLAFHTAQPKDGGAGAVYVLIKNTRATP